MKKVDKTSSEGSEFLDLKRFTKEGKPIKRARGRFSKSPSVVVENLLRTPLYLDSLLFTKEGKSRKPVRGRFSKSISVVEEPVVLPVSLPPDENVALLPEREV